MIFFRTIALLLFILPSGGLLAHEIRPGFLGLKETAPDRFEVTWKQPVSNQRRLPLEPVMPPRCTAQDKTIPELTRSALVQYWRIDCGPEGLLGAEIAIDGLPVTLTDVLVRVDLRDGTVINQVLKPGRPAFTVTADALPRLPAYLTMGISHLISGFDHVLFVIGLLFFIPSTWVLLKTVTAFTLAHSLTLGLSAMNLVGLSQAPVEAVIALSILFLAVELMRDPGSRSNLMSTYPWLIAFVFGLLHGFGFAGALRQIGLPPDTALWALLLFNLGVEIGQLGIIVVALLIRVIAGRFPRLIPAGVVRVPIYAMGTLAAYWVIARVTRMVL